MNEARVNLENIIDSICYEYNYYKPRMYRDNARKDYLSLAKCRKRTSKKILCAIKKQLQYVKRDLGYNECDVLIGTIMNYHQRTGHYPERVLVNQIYRSRKNLAYCKEHGIRVSGPALGRPRQLSKEEKEQAYSDNIDRIEVERGFSLAKGVMGWD